MVSGLTQKTYEDRLKELNLSSLKDRRIRGDMILMWKMKNEKIDLSSNMFTYVSDVSSVFTRGSIQGKFAYPAWKLDLRKNFFCCRVIEKWNALPLTVKNSLTLNEFKNSYDKII